MALKIALPQERFHNYVNALTALGAEVRFSGPDGCDALLLPGGGDLDPARYGQENRGSLDIDPERDALEFALVQQAFLQVSQTTLRDIRSTITTLLQIRSLQLLQYSRH